MRLWILLLLLLLQSHLGNAPWTEGLQAEGGFYTFGLNICCMCVCVCVCVKVTQLLFTCRKEFSRLKISELQETDDSRLMDFKS